ncbi:Receptor-like protein kinase [Melia azedarach]|uniref:Receptor-like protein kinase n=1 Tax=Melia azedarach TaxID=155640 RepID=A0ACC1X7G0_MELAZ|nr:Receptor-like protein kinase [Melia azedarach]
MESHRKIPSLFLTPFCILVLLRHLAVTVAGDSLSTYTPTESIFVACGSSGTSNSSDQRTWVGDIDSEYSPFPASSRSYRASHQGPPYSTSRISLSEFTYRFNVTAGQKSIRLYFYSALYADFSSLKDFFSVNAGSFTLFRNFSVSLNSMGVDKFFKEFFLNIKADQRLLNITFTPSPDYQDSYAFISGIEIVSVPPNLYFTAADDQGFSLVGQENLYSIRNSNVLETLYRINVGGKFISPSNDTGMYRTWIMDDDYLREARPSAVPVNTSIVLSFSVIRNYSAPIEVYTTARTMGKNKTINENYDLTWEFEVDSGFTYFVRLHFCEFQIEITEVGDRVFEIYIADQTTEAEADIIHWAGGNGVPIYKDYAVILIGSKENEKKQNLSIKLHPRRKWRTKYFDAILNGLEIFKVDNSGNLAGPNRDIWIRPQPAAETPHLKSRKSKKFLIAVVCGIVSCSVVISLLFSLWLWRRSSTSTTKSRKYRGSPLTSDLCIHFSISQIKAATRNFDNDLIIGVGGFGNVYKGFINGRITPVAIKRLNPASHQGTLEFQTEIVMLSQLIHVHLVSLVGYCNDDGEMILVYDFMARGTIRDHLYNTNNPPLSWNQRLQICIGAARGLQYLHTGAKHVIIHRDVKTTNILLDEKWVAKVSDFGLSKFGPDCTSKTHVSTAVKGSIGYLDPEYYRLQQLTEKSDVYSFGVVLLEVLCARPPILRTVQDRNQANLAVWGLQCYSNGTIDEIVDPFMKDKINSECLNKFAEVAVSCLNEDGSKRPCMSDVVRGLEFAFQMQESSDSANGTLVEVELSDQISDSRSLTRDVFSDIVTPQGR